MIHVVVTAAVMTSKVTPAKKLLKTIVRLGWESLLAVSSVLVYASEKKCQNWSIVESPNYWVPWWSKCLPFTVCGTPLSSAFWATSDVWIQDLHKVLAYLSVWSKVITHNTLLVLIFFKLPGCWSSSSWRVWFAVVVGPCCLVFPVIKYCQV